MMLLIGGCGGSTVDASAAFASIQVDEARIEHASLAGDAAETCDASEHLCATARTLDDRDANTRCAHASERCSQGREVSP